MTRIAATDIDAVSTHLQVDLMLTHGIGRVEVTAPREILTAFAWEVGLLMESYMETEADADDPLPTPMDTPPPLQVFIAYGGGDDWEVVRDYLRRDGISVTAFTEEDRTSRIALDVVRDMIRGSSVAIVVWSGADTLIDGTRQARQNVIHEAGFAQGVLGIDNVINLREEGVTLPSNLAGLQYVPYVRGALHRTEQQIISLVRAAERRNGSYS
ncbi:TIR domain-containing protein [Microbacterium sp. LMI1-1-1.1]|uniref:TIR domain-containing protein n=1 Tax=Microbacterium sp. LMI1-1-1.1 TaxID=3135223 RepID=UPI0034655C42